MKQKLYCYVDENGQDTQMSKQKRGSFAEASFERDSMSSAPDTLINRITQNSQFVKFNMAESGGHDPHSAKPNETCIRRSPNLWNPLSNHNLIINLRRIFSKDSLQAYALSHKKTTISFDKLRTEGGTTYREETSYAYRFLEAAQKG